MTASLIHNFLVSSPRQNEETIVSYLSSTGKNKGRKQTVVESIWKNRKKMMHVMRRKRNRNGGNRFILPKLAVMIGPSTDNQFTGGSATWETLISDSNTAGTLPSPKFK